MSNSQHRIPAIVFTMCSLFYKETSKKLNLKTNKLSKSICTNSTYNVKLYLELKAVKL